MSENGPSRRVVVEIHWGKNPDAIMRVEQRPIHQFWPLLSPYFRDIFLPPQRRPGEDMVAWSWREDGEERPPTETELAAVRRRLTGDLHAFTEHFKEESGATQMDAGGQRQQVNAELLIAATDAAVSRLLRKSDAELAGFVCRTETGLRLHSWGAAKAATPSRPDARETDVSGTVLVDGQPSAGHEVLLETLDGAEVTRTRSAKDGRFRFAKVPTGKLRVRGSSATVRFPPKGLEISVARESIGNLELRGESGAGPAGKEDKAAAATTPKSTSRHWLAPALALLALAALGGIWFWKKPVLQPLAGDEPAATSETLSSKPEEQPAKGRGLVFADSSAKSGPAEELPATQNTPTPPATASGGAGASVVRFTLDASPTATAPDASPAKQLATKGALEGQPGGTATLETFTRKSGVSASSSMGPERQSAAGTPASGTQSPAAQSTAPSGPSGMSSPGGLAQASATPGVGSATGPAASEASTPGTPAGPPAPPPPSPPPPGESSPDSASPPASPAAANATKTDSPPPTDKAAPPQAPSIPATSTRVEVTSRNDPPEIPGKPEPRKDAPQAIPDREQATSFQSDLKTAKAGREESSASSLTLTNSTLAVATPPPPSPAADTPPSSQPVASWNRTVRLPSLEWRVRLVDDPILPTQPRPMGATEPIETLRQQALDQLHANTPATFRQPEIHTGLALEMPPDVRGPRWRATPPGDASHARAANDRIDIGWAANAPPAGTHELRDERDRPLARLSVASDGSLLLELAEGVRPSRWVALRNRDSSPSSRFEWRTATGRPLPATWMKNVADDTGLWLRLDLPFDAMEPAQQAPLLGDRQTGWGLVSRARANNQSP